MKTEAKSAELGEFLGRDRRGFAGMGSAGRCLEAAPMGARKGRGHTFEVCHGLRSQARWSLAVFAKEAFEECDF